MPPPCPPTRHIAWGKWDHLHALAALIQRHILVMPAGCMLESFEGFACRDAAGSGVTGASSSAGHSAGYSLLKNCFDTQKASAACLSQFSVMETICLSFLVCLLFWHCCHYGIFATGERRGRSASGFSCKYFQVFTEKRAPQSSPAEKAAPGFS